MHITTSRELNQEGNGRKVQPIVIILSMFVILSLCLLYGCIVVMVWLYNRYGYISLIVYLIIIYSIKDIVCTALRRLGAILVFTQRCINA